jgi:hypothetical protein
VHELSPKKKELGDKEPNNSDLAAKANSKAN